MKTERIAPLNIQTEALVAKATYKRSTHGDWLKRLTHSIYPTALHSFTIPLTLLLPYKQGTVDFQFNRSGCELQRSQSKHYSFSCLCYGDSNLLQRGKLDKWEKSLLLLPQLNPALTMNQCPKTILTSGLRETAVYQRKIKANKEVICPKELTVSNDQRKNNSSTHTVGWWNSSFTTARIQKGRSGVKPHFKIVFGWKEIHFSKHWNSAFLATESVFQKRQDYFCKHTFVQVHHLAHPDTDWISWPCSGIAGDSYNAVQSMILLKILFLAQAAHMRPVTHKTDKTEHGTV